MSAQRTRKRQAARQRARAPQAQSQRPRISTRTLWVFAGGIAIALAAVVLVVVLANRGGGSGSSSTPASEGPAVTGAADTTAMLRGIPQQGMTLGSPKAPVTLVEYADLQCPYCRQFAMDALPAIVAEYVKPGKVKMEFRGVTFLGPDSVKALQTAVAAGQQKKGWNVVDLLYHNQGEENTGWVTDPVLHNVLAAVPGLKVAQAVGAAQSADVSAKIAEAQTQANTDGVQGTPTFFAGRTGGTLQQVPLKSLDAAAMRPTLDRLLKQR